MQQTLKTLLEFIFLTRTNYFQEYAVSTLVSKWISAISLALRLGLPHCCQIHAVWDCELERRAIDVGSRRANVTAHDHAKNVKKQTQFVFIGVIQTTNPSHMAPRLIFPSQRMKLHARNHPKGYVEILERQQDQLVAALRQSYRLLKEANAWSGPPLAETDGHPLTHDLLAALHVLEPDYEITKANTIFEEDYDKIRSSLIDQRRNSSQSYGSPEADSVNGPLTPFAVESAQPTSILQQYKGCEEVSSSQVQGTESPRHLSSPSSLASFDFGELPSPSQEFPRSWEEMTRASLPTSLPMLTLATDTPMRQTDLSTPDRDKGSISSLNFDFNRLDQPSKPQPDLGLEARRLSIRLSDGPIRLASDEEPYDFFDGMMELCLGWAM